MLFLIILVGLENLISFQLDFNNLYIFRIFFVNFLV